MTQEMRVSERERGGGVTQKGCYTARSHLRVWAVVPAVHLVPSHLNLLDVLHLGARAGVQAQKTRFQSWLKATFCLQLGRTFETRRAFKSRGRACTASYLGLFLVLPLDELLDGPEILDVGIYVGSMGPGVQWDHPV